MSSRVRDLIPSAPMTRSNVSLVPSSNSTSAPPLQSWHEGRRPEFHQGKRNDSNGIVVILVGSPDAGDAGASFRAKAKEQETYPALLVKALRFFPNWIVPSGSCSASICCRSDRITVKKHSSPSCRSADPAPGIASTSGSIISS